VSRAADFAIALDLASGAEALALVDEVGDACAWYKVGPVLFVSDGRSLVRSLRERGKRVFLDLKWHDIPSTVAGAVAAAVDLGVELATVHLLGGPRMLEAACGARRGALRLAGVGVLTSLGPEEFTTVVGRPVIDVAAEQLRLVSMALGSGLDGFVTAAAEAAAIRAAAGPAALLVVPGIRRAHEAGQDQRRTATPAEAVRAGADLLVVGRPIASAANRRAAALSLRSEISAS
jgi:orotidine-5'-phosphate decarboxylase